ncbi:hypothetical protein PR202_ga26711 [Eleusine coracana subsp. coracana]|uniref:Uncharacterized protein n=1 Tax=Eleusine coracana subsp. coracana TaxID=191504 RepID=A0AAV5DF70_ELECO|nr:hypothetical protein PR202_ga26711 [Eleusine coracana subsp. coracana]
MAGGSIRAAAKAAMVGGYRSAAAVRRSVLPSSSQPPHTSSAADGRRASTTIAMDDWVIPDHEVFGPVPTHEEAMAATLDLSEAFQMCSFSYHTSAKSDPKAHAKVAPVSALLEVSHSETPQDVSKQEDNYENLLVSSGAPGRIVQAFTMLNESPEAQDVVASLASDKNVWDAVMKNEKVMKFYKRLETKLSDSSSVASSVTEDEMEVDDDAASSQNSNDLSPMSGESIKDYVERMKALVSEMVSNLSNMMQDLVATSNEGRCKGKLKTMVVSASNDFANNVPSTFVLLAIASIMVVLLKRV